MDKQLQKSIVEYYSSLIRIDDKWKELRKDIEKPLNNLKNQSEQLRLVSDDSLDNAEICSDKKLREIIIFKIHVGIEEELSSILDLISQLNNLAQELKNKLKRLEETRSKVNLNSEEMQEFVNGTPLRPRLNLLMEWAIDSSKYYSDLYTSINASMKNLNCKNDDTIENLIKSFNEDKKKRADIDRILGFTQFITKENLE